ncbi:MFS general substrate transporter [Tothia fuscella]|uniref:MFS general substrate transporter n=1 Tax=Tothia fuscella TaxID=1048955 RepID=A0A9P4TVK6_9PEZI|nr:MFS general substrate transporter [Tothia fuscella]
MVMNWQLFDAFGIFLGFTANLIAGDHWRFQMASAALPCLILLSLIWIVPESPRWLLKKNRLPDAFSSFVALRQTPLQAAAEMFYANAQIQAEVRLLPPKKRDDEAEAVHNQRGYQISQPLRGPEESQTEQSPVRTTLPSQEDNLRSEAKYEEEEEFDACLSLRGRLKRFWHALTMQDNDAELEEFQRCAKSSYYFSRILQLFRIKRIRRATIGALVVMISQQLCGINILQFYSSTFVGDLTVDQGDPKRDSIKGLWLSWGIGLANFLFTFPVYYLIDGYGRRFLLLSSYPGMALSMLAACLSFRIADDEKRAAVVIFWIFCFVFFYSWGQGPVPFAYSSEVFPLLNREAGMSFAVFVNLFGAGTLALVVPQLTQALTYGEKDSNNVPIYRNGQSRLLGLFAGLCVLAFCLIFLLVPETAGATLGDRGSLNHISLEELNYIFGVPTLTHVRYQITQMIPYAYRRVRWSIKSYISRRDVLNNKPEAPYEPYQWVTLENIRQEQRERETSPAQNAASEKEAPGS